MKRILWLLLAACTSSALTLDAADAAVWRGVLVLEDQSISLEVTVHKRDGQAQGIFRIKDKGSRPLSRVKLDENVFEFSIDKIGVSFSGTLSKQQTIAAGTFSQREKSRELILWKAPQEPVQTRETWAGTLTIQNMALAMQLRLVGDASKAGGAIFDSLDERQSYRATWAIENGEFTFSVPFIQLQFRGVMNKAGILAEGYWRQPGRELPFRLQKQAVADSRDIAEKEQPSASPRLPEETQTEQILKSTPIPQEALTRLAQEVQTMVDQEEIVGGELLIVKNNQTLMRQAFGWHDREKAEPMKVNAVYCVRSMTKPLVGTAIQMLIDANQLQLDTYLHQVLPVFRNPQMDKITIKHLLEHTSGLPFLTTRQSLDAYRDMDEMIAEIAAAELEFEPGDGFTYSDAGSIALGAVVTKISKVPVAQFIQEQILKPLGMKDSFPLIGGDKQVLSRIPSAYSGGTGAWSKHWEAEDPPIFPMFLTSASLFSTTTDYARFLNFWMNGGRIGKQQLLTGAAIKRGLEPKNKLPDYPSNFQGLETYYGQQWITYVASAGHAPKRPVIFGHDGSDGTHVWVWPEQQLMVLFFTQSRGTLAGLALQRHLDEWLIRRKLNEPKEQVVGEEQTNLAEFAGLYWDETAKNAYYVITPKGKRLQVERPGRMYQTFKPGKVPGRFYHEASSKIWFEFLRGSDGIITGMRTSFGGRIEHNPRHNKPHGLPNLAELIEGVKRSHRLDLLPTLGVMRMKGTLNFVSRGMVGQFTSVFDHQRERSEIRFGPTKEMALKKEGQVWTYSSLSGAEKLTGPRKEQALLDQVSVRYGDWRLHYDRVEVLKRIKAGNLSLILIRVKPKAAPGATMFVDEASGRLVAMDSLVQVPAVGMVGVHTRFGDFRDVEGMSLPFRSEARFAHNLLGKVVTRVESIETRVKERKKMFAVPRFSKK